ncbi:hypothetical protein VCHA50P416_20302 [Vibrio chagasii]|nr:hypothetical protein VCHA43P272_20301 [Vibrio chagasii]CAH7368527.1 hypothetical protein VCHA50P416_20302 [Vibrio chagasii]
MMGIEQDDTRFIVDRDIHQVVSGTNLVDMRVVSRFTLVMGNK